MPIEIPRNHLGKLLELKRHQQWKTYLILLAMGGEAKSFKELSSKTDFDEVTVADAVEILKLARLVRTEQMIPAHGSSIRVFIAD